MLKLPLVPKHSILITSFMDSVMILYRPLTNQYINVVAYLVRGVYSSIIMYKILVIKCNSQVHEHNGFNLTWLKQGEKCCICIVFSSLWQPCIKQGCHKVKFPYGCVHTIHFNSQLYIYKFMFSMSLSVISLSLEMMDFVDWILIVMAVLM